MLPYPDVNCEPDGVQVHMDTGGVTPTPDTTAPTGDTASGTDGPCGCVTVGTWYRFDVLGLDKLDGEDHPVIATLNPLWAADIGKTELNILFEVTAASADALTVRAVNAARTGSDGEMCVLESTSVTFDFPRDGCDLTPSSESAINVYAGDEEHPKNCTTVLPVPHAIPVEQVVLQATMSDDCSAIQNGTVVTGVIGEHALLSTCTCLVLGPALSEQCEALEPGYESEDGLCVGCNANYMDLESLLNSFGALEYKCTTLDDGPGVCIDGHFSAVQMDAAPPSCEE